MATQAQKEVHHEIDSLKAEIQQTKQELASPQHKGEAAQVDFLQKHLLQLNSQLVFMREQQTILMRSTQQTSPCYHLSETEPPLKKRQLDQPPAIQAAADPLDQVVGSIQSQGFAWLKIPESETHAFHRLNQFAHDQPGSCFDQAGEELRDKKLVEHFVGKPHPKMSQAVCEAADEVCKLMDRHTRRVLEAISSSRHMGLPANALNSILDDPDSTHGEKASSCLHINQYFAATDDWLEGRPHTDRGVLTLIWSDSKNGLLVTCPLRGSLEDVDIPDGYMLVLAGHTLEHATCGIFKAAPHTANAYYGSKRVSFAYKLRSPDDAVLDQYASLAARGKHFDDKYMRKITVSTLMDIFRQSHMSINHLGADMVHMGLSPEWQYAVTEWRVSRHTVDHGWIWHKLISTMDGWKAPDQTIFLRTLWNSRLITMRVHPTWKVVGIESLLEVVHGMGPPGSVMFTHQGRPIQSKERLSETAVQNESTIQLAYRMRGD